MLTLHPFLVLSSQRVELYLYSPHGPYGLYRASVPVQGCALPFILPDTHLQKHIILMVISV